MIKEQRMYNTVITLQNGLKNCISYFEDGTVIQTINSGNVRYDANNSINSCFIDNDNAGCTDEIEWHHFDSALHKYNLGTMLSASLIIRSERCRQRISVKGCFSVFDTLYTTAEMLIIFGNTCSPITVKRNIFIKGIPDKDNVMNAVDRELSKLNNQFGHYISSDLSAVNPEEYEIILPAGIGGIFIHEAVGHCLEGDLFFEKDNVLRRNLGKRITQNSITVSDRCNVEDMVYYGISDDGGVPEEVILINDGILEGVMTDANISMKYKMKNTGNGRAVDCFNFPIPRMRNTYLHNGNEAPENIIKTTKKGIIATDIVGGSVTSGDGEFVFNINHGLVVEHGEIVGVTKPFLFSSNIANALDRINAIGNDLEFYPSKCEKNGQQINVSFGQPTIRIEKRGSHL